MGMEVELPGKLSVHEICTSEEEHREGMTVVPKGRRRSLELHLRVQLHTFEHFTTASEREHSSVIGSEVTVGHGHEDLRCRRRERCTG